MPPELEDQEVKDITTPGSGGEAHEQEDANGGADDKQDTNAELRKAMETLAGTVTQLAKPKEVAVTKTPEQLAEEWGVFDPKKVDEKFFHDFFGIPEDAETKVLEKKMRLFAEMQKGVVKQAIMGALKVMRDNDLAKMREEYQPATTYASEARAERTRTRFFESYPSLQDTDAAKFSGVINAVATQLAQVEFPDEAAYFKALAEGAAKTIQGVIPTFALGAVKPKPTAGTTPRLPRTSVGGSGGAGSGGGIKPTKKTDDDSGSIDW